MKILVYSETSNHTLLANLGAPEYSYFFVLQAFLPVLRQIGDVQVVGDPSREVDPIFHDCSRRSESCIFLSFSPPHRTFTTLKCPTIPVFAWEFDDIPCESWGEDKYSNWQAVLALLPGAIVHSGQTADAVKRAMGNKYPVSAIPAPIWSRVESKIGYALGEAGELTFEGRIFDSRLADWTTIADHLYWDRKGDRAWLVSRGESVQSAIRDAVLNQAHAVVRRTTKANIVKIHLSAFYGEVLADLVPEWIKSVARHWIGRRSDVPMSETLVISAPDPSDIPQPIIPEALAELLPSGAQRLCLSGVIYCAVLNPEDGRKNIKDMIAAFCEAFREDEGVTLLIKLTHAKPERALSGMIAQLYRNTPFACRIVLIAGYLDDESYQKLIALTSYVVNTSYGEGQCLPLMEFMSAGKPAVAPDSSAMADYITTENAFVVASSREMTSWPQDLRHAYRTFRYRLNFDSLVNAFKASRSARMDAKQYENMSNCARKSLRRHCSDEVIAARLIAFLDDGGDARILAPDGQITGGEYSPAVSSLGLGL